MDTKTLISLISLAFAIFSGVLVIRRNNKADDATEASKMTTVIVKLENMMNVLNEVRAEINSLKEDIREYREKQIIMDQSLKQAWHQIDELKEAKAKVEALINDMMVKIGYVKGGGNHEDS